MMNKFDQRIENSIVEFTRLTTSKPWLILFIITLLSLGMFAGVSKLSFSNSYRIFFSNENPELTAFDNFLETYSKNDSALIVFHLPEDSHPNETLIQRPYLETLQWATEQAWSLPFATRVDSLTNFQYSYSADDELYVEDLYQDLELMDDIEIIRRGDVAINEVILRGNLISPNKRTSAISVTVNMPEQSLDEVPTLAKAVRDLKADIQQRHPELKIALSGVVMLNNAFSEASMNDIATLVPGMYLLIFITACLVLKRINTVIATLVVIFFSCLGAMGMTGHIGIPLSPTSVSAPTIIMTLAIADSIHIIVTMMGFYKDKEKKQEAIIESIRINFAPIFLTSLTTVIGFLTLNFSDAPPLWHLGNITAIGIILAWLFSLTLLPALLSILPIKPVPEKNNQHNYLTALSTFIIKQQKLILLIGGASFLTLAFYSSKIELNDEFVKYFGEGIEFRRDADFTTEKLSGLYIVEYTLKSGSSEGIHAPSYLERVETFAQWLRQQEVVKHVYSHTDIIKRLNKNMHNDDQDFYQLPKTKEEAAQYLLLYELSLPQGLDLNNRISVDKSETRLTVIIESISSKELQEFNNLAHEWQIEQQWPEVMQTKATGTAIMFAYISKRNVVSMLDGNVLAILTIGIIMLLMLRSWVLGGISIIANAAPIIMMFGVWALLVG